MKDGGQSIAEQKMPSTIEVKIVCEDAGSKVVGASAIYAESLG